MYLTYQDQLRNESDEEVIDNLLRKGWQETVPPEYNSVTQYTPEWVDGTWVVNDKYPDTNSILQLLADTRYSKEVAGITIGEQPVTTYRDEMTVWQGMLLDITLRPGMTPEYEYKPRNGTNVLLTSQQVMRVYECFAWYVNACFATERYLASLIPNTPQVDLVTLINTESTWPQRHFEWVAP